MKNIDELLNKYFQALSALDEEKQLKEYFSSDAVKPEHLKYKSLFGFFEKEKTEKLEPTIKDKLVKSSDSNTSKTTFRILLSLASGIAAAILLFVILQLPKHKAIESYIVINGQKTANAQLAYQYAEDKIDDLAVLLGKSVAPINQTEDVLQGSLQPISQTETAIEIISNYENDISAIINSSTLKNNSNGNNSNENKH